ncbi:hypothetical protein [Paeniglutamicibacter cryotolerans]|uniref:Uncharacterized protein n=1 Tax=Paeniglutamicibacter cryotolerans TaxID=670079 RepID=A0A839QH29_9MICC|nr:hypothetical protein [Paeniglutamicibacter cryotolerans]MBB2995037.1 hypothetical protein [Paeniglutamicibacter cryotolerans]
MRVPAQLLSAHFAAALLLTACTAQPESGCAEPALLVGFPVEVEATAVPANGLEELTLSACQDGICRETTLPLTPGSKTIDLGCGAPSPGSNPGDAQCSASASPDGSLLGHWSTVEFSTGPITFEASAPGFGPYRGTVTGLEASTGVGACVQSAFQTTLRITAAGINTTAG